MLGKSLSDSWAFFRTHGVALAMIVLPIVAPIEILISLYQSFMVSNEFVLAEQAIPMIASFMVYPVYSVAVVYYIASIISGRPRNTRELWSLGLRYWQPFIILSLLVTVAVMFGLFLLILPGVIIAVRVAFAEFELLLNDRKPMEAIKIGWAGTREYMWVILGGYAVITASIYIPLYFLGAAFDETSGIHGLMTTVINIAYQFLAVFYTIFAFRVYDIARTEVNRPTGPDTP
ncbi:MAG: hypothetical protein WD623_00550 [Marinobacter sp.]|uniref:hypothetical protein n=1 Tax=Marinobacter sp. TaxID=50741 RepID=UPI0034A03F44